MNILLAGGAGYIGTHTAIELISLGYNVIIADNFANSKLEAVTNTEKIAGQKIPLYNIDVADVVALDKVFSENKIDAVIHFAGLKILNESIQIPVKYYRNNLDTTLSLLEVMAKHKVNKIIFSSSASVYGIPERVPIDESMPVSCSNPYGWTKIFIEQILADTAKANPDFSVILLRYFNPVGAHSSGIIGENPTEIPTNLFPYISQVAFGKLNELKIYGNNYPTKDGTGIRDYIHIVDLAKGHVAALDYAQKHKGSEIINIGTGVGYSVLDIVKAFEETNNVKVPYKIAERRSGDVAECYADASKAALLLNWKAEKTLEDMCKDAWRWQKKSEE
jgi:UDP-glucose-4-epimerase